MTQQNTDTPPSPEEARELYRVAARVKELAPWEWMDESAVFGVQDPETGETGFVSVMGMAGEHFAVAVYLGAEGLYGILDFASAEVTTTPEQLLDIPQLQASFENRDLLDKKDRDLIKKLGLKFRGAHAWPMFRSYGPGLMPWFVTAGEARLLTHALAQTLEVAPRVKDDPDILWAEDDEDGETYLVRVPQRQGDGLAWEDRMVRVPPPERETVAATLPDAELLGQLKQLPRRALELEIDLRSLPTGVGERGERPYRPYMLMLADGKSGLIVGVELLKPEPSLAEMRGQVPTKLAQWLAQAGVVPGEISVRSELLLEMLEPFARTLDIKLRQTDFLPAIDEAVDSMFTWMAGGQL
jgi:hypothetical protein